MSAIYTYYFDLNVLLNTFLTQSYRSLDCAFSVPSRIHFSLTIAAYGNLLANYSINRTIPKCIFLDYRLKPLEQSNTNFYLSVQLRFGWIQKSDAAYYILDAYHSGCARSENAFVLLSKLFLFRQSKSENSSLFCKEERNQMKNYESLYILRKT